MATDTLVNKKPINAAGNSSSPRKRRRRTTATGAADDCFACQDNSSACDRRRPYCTQCIERGKTCSGYKTTLTWGVGVASRGKLRGLSLPVARQQKAAAPVQKKTTIPKSIQEDRKPSTVTTAAPTSHPTSFDFVPVDPNLHLYNAPRTQMDYQPSHPPSHPSSHPVSSSRTDTGPNKRHVRGMSLQPLAMPSPMGSYTQSPGPLTASALPYSPFEPFGASPQTPGYDSPNDHPSLQKYFPNPQTWTGAFSTHYYTQPPMTYTGSPTISSTSYPRQTVDLDGFDPSSGIFEMEDIEEIDRTDQEMSSIRAMYGMPNVQIGSTQALRELINYFDQVISPVIVAFEGPDNPYRTHILPLATETPALQHAIAALSASNLRIRKDHEEACNNRRLESSDPSTDDLHDASVRKSSIAHSYLSSELSETSSIMPGRPSNRELYHKGESIKALNAILRDPNRRDDDSVLATLLILCLYHICDTGVAKFKTQFAGVKRLLTLRAKRATKTRSKWLITMFRWFDAMAATVNDREGQFDEEKIIEELPQNDEWSLENLAGCDSRLFSIIAKLGRLNVLSQGKAVRGSMLSRALPVRPSDFDGLSYRNFDGNGWSRLETGDETQNGIQTQFWTEFSSIRQELHDWRFDPANVSIDTAASGGQQFQSNSLDLENISQAFRFAALLYTERLGSPQVPSSANNFQALVASAIHFIDAVKSDVYLLWPLFITGTECVLPEHRDLIRRRCLSIQGDSGFYNNTSTLRILEEVWKDNDNATNLSSSSLHIDVYSLAGVDSADGPLKWRKAMLHTAMDGEYIVV